MLVFLRLVQRLKFHRLLFQCSIISDKQNNIDLSSDDVKWKNWTVTKLTAIARVILPAELRGRGHALPTKRSELITLLTRLIINE